MANDAISGMTFTYNRAFGRSDGLLTRAQQQTLRESAVVVAGCGGDGGLLAERLARAGVAELRLADPESFAIENTNRQFAADSESMGRNKAEIVAAAMRAINPEIRLRVCPEGVTAANVAEMVGGATIAVDEIEFSLPAVSLMLAAAARNAGIPTIVGANVGFGANVFALGPHGRTLEEHCRASGGALGDGGRAAFAQARALPASSRLRRVARSNGGDAGSAAGAVGKPGRRSGGGGCKP